MLADSLRVWLLDALRAEPGSDVLLAVGESTLPLYTVWPSDDPAWEGKRILPLDELVPAPPRDSFFERLCRAVPAGLRSRCAPIETEPSSICAGVLGLGPDGRIAFNQPPSEADSVTRIVSLTDENRARIADASPRALTVGVGTILRAARVALVVSGANKAQALRRVLEGPEGSDVPASFLRRHEALTVFVDASTCG